MRARVVWIVVALVAAIMVAAAVWPRPRVPVIASLPSGEGVTAAAFDYGDDVLQTAKGPEQLTGALYYPTNIAGLHRLILLQHGGHTPCADPSAAYPCAKPEDRTDSYLGYGYLGEALARQGYVVVSMSAESTVSSAYTDEQATVVNAHLALWQTWATEATGPFGATFVGHLDLASVGLIGHSRGGEAMARVAAGQAGSQPAAAISGVYLIAPALPVDGSAPPQPSAPMAALMGTCDGDVGEDPAQFVTSPQASAATADRSLVTVSGANHNFYNTRWMPGSGVADAVDDADSLVATRPDCATASPQRLTADQQQNLAGATATAYFRAAFAGPTPSTALQAIAENHPALTALSSP